MHGLTHDFKIALRNLRTQPWFSLMVIGMLALGIAGNGAIFSIFNSLFLRPLPFPESNRVIELDETAPRWNLKYVGVSNPDAYQWRTGLVFFRPRLIPASGRRTFLHFASASPTRPTKNPNKKLPTTTTSSHASSDCRESGRLAQYRHLHSQDIGAVNSKQRDAPPARQARIQSCRGLPPHRAISMRSE
jgi:hypothetical protein